MASYVHCNAIGNTMTVATKKLESSLGVLSTNNASHCIGKLKDCKP